jgi:plasmid stabilization system protein ParE
LRPLRVAPLARRDLEQIFATSEERFGQTAAHRYRRLVAAAFRDLRQDSTRIGVQMRDDLPTDIRLYHLRHSRSRTGDRISRPRHFLAFGEVGGELVIFRVLHDGMDLAQHL